MVGGEGGEGNETERECPKRRRDRRGIVRLRGEKAITSADIATISGDRSLWRTGVGRVWKSKKKGLLQKKKVLGSVS